MVAILALTVAVIILFIWVIALTYREVPVNVVDMQRLESTVMRLDREGQIFNKQMGVLLKNYEKKEGKSWRN